MAFEQHVVGETHRTAHMDSDLVIAKTADGPRMHVQAVTLRFDDRERIYYGLVDGQDDHWTFAKSDTVWVDVERS